MEEDDFLLDDEDNLEEAYLDSEEEEDSDEGVVDEDLEASSDDTGEYGGKISQAEVKMSSCYDDIIAASAQDTEYNLDGQMFSASIVDGVRNILDCIPKNTSKFTVEKHTLGLFQKQAHNRIPASIYTPDTPLRAGTLGEEFGGDEDGFNEEYTKQAREQIARFVEYLSTRDLSKDSVVSRRRKQRQLPALIIFLFSSGMYDLILNCPTMPEEYNEQIIHAFKEIQNEKYKIVENLARRYEEKGRDKVAERVRKMGLEWFTKEPAQLRSLKAFADLDLTYDDILIYREIRPSYINASKSITQEFISDLIEVVIELGRVHEKLKDKTRGDAIADVKKVYRDWSRENPMDTELAQRIIWKDLKLSE